MNIDKVIYDLNYNCLADPFDRELAEKFIKRLEETKNKKFNILGSLLIYLLTKAENGDFE